MNARVVGLLNPGRAGEQEAVDVSPPGPKAGHSWQGHSLDHLVPWPKCPLAITAHCPHRATETLAR